MKKGIHPEYKESVFTCGCGSKIATRSTIGDRSIAICSKCHPFFTGKQKYVDTAGRVEKFQRRYGWAAENAEKIAEGKRGPAEKPAPEPAEAPAEEPSEE
jgi:large subunit ribosomal protein L31